MDKGRFAQPVYTYATSITGPVCTSATGAITIDSVGGGTRPYTYHWSNGAATLSISGLVAGAYVLTITDAHGCTLVVRDSLVAGSSSLSDSNAAISQPICKDAPNGSITLSAANGMAPYRYRWSNADTSQTISGLGAGIYSVTVTDANGCTARLTDTLRYQYPNCCASTGSAALALTFGSGTSTQLLANIATAFPGNVTGDTILHNMTTPAQSIYINGLITLDSDLYLVNCPNIIFNTHAGILVTNGHNLYIQGSTLYACGDSMWQGIEVSGTGSMVIVRNNGTTYSMIRDARRAIYSHGGAQDSIQKCRFINNWDGIYLDGTAGIPLFSVSNCVFTTNTREYGALKADTADNPSSTAHYASLFSDVGIYVKSQAGNSDVATIGSLTGYVDSFTHLNCGVRCWANSLEVVHSAFDSINLPGSGHSYTQPYLGRAIYVADSLNNSGRNTLKIGDPSPAGADTIGYCYRGLDEIGTTQNAYIGGNRITNATEYGIYMGPDKNAKSIQVVYNTIDATHTHNVIPYGINLTTCGYTVRITGNTIKLIDSTTYSSSHHPTIQTTGIEMTSPQTGDILIDSNLVTHVHTGIYTNQSNKVRVQSNQISLSPIPWSTTSSYYAGIMSKADQNLQTSDNLIDGNPAGYGISYPRYTDNSSLVGKLMGIYIQSQTGSNIISCNGIQDTHWGIAASGNAAGHQILQNNRFFLDTAGVVVFASGHLGVQGIGATNMTNDNEWDTTTVRFKMGVYSTVGTSDSFYLRGTTASIYNPNLIERIIGGSQFSVASISSPSNSIAICPLPTPTFHGRSFVDIHYLESIAMDSIAFVSDTIDNLKWSDETLVSMIQSDTTLLDSSAILASYYSVVSDSSFSLLMYIFNGMTTDTDASNLAYYQSINSGIKPLDQNEANLMQVNTLYLNYFMSMPDSFSQTGNLMDSTDLATLYSVASQCYLTGGPAVFLARSMYSTAIRDDSTFFWDDCVNPLCDHRILSTDAPQSIPVDSSYFFKVYPNPMDKENSLNVKCSEPGDITFYDLLGQITYKGHLVAGINKFDCTQLSCDNDVILYKAKMRSGKLEIGKVVTLK